MGPLKITPSWLGERKRAGQPIAALTAYDYPMTRLLDEAGVPVLLVGDSLGMVVLGYPDTTRVTMEEMEHHVRAAARARPRALLAADLPFGSYNTPDQAVANARRLMQAGAEAVKAEGGAEILDCARAIVQAGIPFIGHVGMLPQHIHEEGRYRIKGKFPEEQDRLRHDVRVLSEAGALAVVLELVAADLAAELTRASPIPTIGIGSGSGCDGQILVTHDLVGTFPWFTPRFVTPRLQAAAKMTEAVRAWMESLTVPAAAHEKEKADAH